MNPYPAYKDPGVAWIGEVPEHWDIKKIKYRCYVKGRVGWKGLTSSEFLQNGFAYLVTGTDFIGGQVNWESCYYINQERYDEDPYIQLKNEDLLITKDGTIGKLAIVKGLDKPACLNSGIFVVRSLNDDFTTQYLYWVLRSDMFTKFNEYTSYGSTIQHLYQNVFVEFAFSFPTLIEQTTIAVYLDRKTAQIDTLIKHKRRLVQLLQEELTALISHTVTKGLNPAAKMKNSGIGWIGKVPEGWEVVRLGYIADVSNGSTPDTSRADYWENGSVPWLSSGKVNDYFVERPSKLITEKALCECSVSLYPAGTVILGMIGQGKTRGTSAYLKISACINQNLAGIVPRERLNGRYLHQFLVSSYEWIREYGRGGNQAAINCQLVSDFRIPLPPVEEQTIIAAYLDEKNAQIDQTIARTERQIALLQEYRAALISMAVTGKIDVCEETAL